MTHKLTTITAIITLICFLTSSCGNEGVKKDEKPVDISELTKDQPETHGSEVSESDIKLSNPLDQTMVAAGKATYELKCQSCHRLTEEKLVGPGWKNVTKQRKPVWIMNMITNVEMMLETDPEAQKLLEQCLVRMPNQNITTDEARQVLEFMRSNDGEK
ncbi:MAG TPA: c-type cytochrome [Chitinophagaceae bacterium]|nr:cytochrome c [Chitinophagaceae bacterium]MCB9054436.1 cytochrome c [Chitinophagales bacterium]HPG11099.1 c-type cytochrome [Chitinophagaceae bacterium]HRX92691.1 c-type cytochrome [Chitinophagaceae bacterium]